MTDLDKLKEKHEENKRKIKAMGPVKITLLLLLIIATVCSFVFYDYIHGENNIFNGVDPETNLPWDYGSAFLNDVMELVPRVMISLRLITIMLVVVTVLLIIVRKVFNKTQRGVTVGMLIINLVHWITAIVLVLVILYQWGVDAAALITGAGVVTLVVGLGMQSLIADVVAGLFIVFENEFNVGDWITVDDFRGEVIEIGIRTTRLKAAGNVKIINNNSIQGVLNQSLDYSLVKTYIDIEYGENIPKVESIINANIGKLKIPGAVDEVVYDGVESLGASGVTVRFSCHCLEGDIYTVTRALNGAVKNMFDENGINIPFPQVVIHQGE